MENSNMRIDEEWLLDRAQKQILIRGFIAAIPAIKSGPQGRTRIRLEAVTAMEYRQVWFVSLAVYLHKDPWRPGERASISLYNFVRNTTARDSILTRNLWLPADPLLGIREAVIVARDDDMKRPDPLVWENLIRMQDRIIRRAERIDGDLRYTLVTNLAVRLQTYLREQRR